jgi:hypothetical protein
MLPLLGDRCGQSTAVVLDVLSWRGKTVAKERTGVWLFPDRDDTYEFSVKLPNLAMFARCGRNRTTGKMEWDVQSVVGFLSARPQRMAHVRRNRRPTANLDAGHCRPALVAARRIRLCVQFPLDFSLDVREEIGERRVIQFDPFAALECSDSDPDFTLEIRQPFVPLLEQSQPPSDHLLLAAEMAVGNLCLYEAAQVQRN